MKSLWLGHYDEGCGRGSRCLLVTFTVPLPVILSSFSLSVHHLMGVGGCFLLGPMYTPIHTFMIDHKAAFFFHAKTGKWFLSLCKDWEMGFTTRWNKCAFSDLFWCCDWEADKTDWWVVYRGCDVGRKKIESCKYRHWLVCGLLTLISEVLGSMLAWCLHLRTRFIIRNCPQGPKYIKWVSCKTGEW